MRWLKVLLTILAAAIAVAGGLITIAAIAAGVLILWAVQRWLGLLPPRKSATAGGPRSSATGPGAHREAARDVIDISATEVSPDEAKG
jgi:ABC-type branched-subunit amino acid transport system permease subunit